MQVGFLIQNCWESISSGLKWAIVLKYSKECLFSVVETFISLSNKQNF